MTLKGALKSALKTAAVPPLRVAVDLIGKARTPDGQWFDTPKGFHPLDFINLWAGRYEAPEMKILEDHFAKDHTIIEIGANIGVVTRTALKDKLTENGMMLCIEANPDALPCLKSNLARSVNGNRAEILPFAIGAPDVEGEIQSFVQKKNLASGLDATAKLKGSDRKIDVAVFSLSAIVNKYAGKGYSLICDAEGAEILILEKDSQSLERCNQIVIELHPPSQTGRDVTQEQMVEQLKDLGFHHGPSVHNTHYFSRQPVVV